MNKNEMERDDQDFCINFYLCASVVLGFAWFSLWAMCLPLGISMLISWTGRYHIAAQRGL